MQGTGPTSNCSSGLPVDVFWHARPDLCGLDEHIDLIAEALMGAITVPTNRRWNPYNLAMARQEFRHRLIKASKGELVPVDHVKSIDYPLAAEMFEIRWQGITVTQVVDSRTRHDQIQVRLLHAEPAKVGVVALGLHAHEKTVVKGDKRATRAAQDAEIVTAIGVYDGALPLWLRRAPTCGLDRPDPAT